MEKPKQFIIAGNSGDGFVSYHNHIFLDETKAIEFLDMIKSANPSVNFIIVYMYEEE